MRLNINIGNDIELSTRDISLPHRLTSRTYGESLGFVHFSCLHTPRRVANWNKSYIVTNF